MATSFAIGRNTEMPNDSITCRSRDERQNRNSARSRKYEEDEDLPDPPPNPWLLLERLDGRERIDKETVDLETEEEEEEEEEMEEEEEEEAAEYEDEDEDDDVDETMEVTEEDQQEALEEEEEEEIIAYLTGIGTTSSCEQPNSSDCYRSRNSTTSNPPTSDVTYTEDAFEQLDRLYGLTERILEIRERGTKLFKRVRDLERLNVLRRADARVEKLLTLTGDSLEVASIASDLPDQEDADFSESLLDAILSNVRTSHVQRRGVRSPTMPTTASVTLAATSSTTTTMTTAAGCVEGSLHGRNRSLGLSERSAAEGATPATMKAQGAPKVSKWTRVKAAFRWEKACSNDTAELDVTTGTMTGVSSKYLKIPDASTSGSGEPSEQSTPASPRSNASSSNEDVFERHRRQPSERDNAERNEAVCRNVEGSHSRPLIRISSEDDAVGAHLASKTRSSFCARKEADVATASRKLTPILRIAIPRSNEAEQGAVSSAESVSPLPSNAFHSYGESLPRRSKTHRDARRTELLSKRQRSMAEEPVSPTSKMRRRDSKWNKVRRAFLTNATFSVPPSPVKLIGKQTFLQDNITELSRARSCSGSIENLSKSSASKLNARTETQRDYEALREKLGAEFHRKLVEWERMKSASARGGKNSHDEFQRRTSFSLQEGLLISEERLAPEFKKKLQEWKQAKKERRAGSPVDHQRSSMGRRRLTDWQLWRSTSKADGGINKTREATTTQRLSCSSIASIGSVGSDNKSRMYEGLVKRMETWKRLNGIALSNFSKQAPLPSGRFHLPSGTVDETEFLALERVLMMLKDVDSLQRRDDVPTDAAAPGRNVHSPDAETKCGEVLIQTSVGSYRFEGISQEFTRKLYDWEKYRGISPRSSTFRLLDPGYASVLGTTNDMPPTSSINTTTTASNDGETILSSIKKSKSVGNIVKSNDRDEIFVYRSASLQSLNRSSKKGLNGLQTVENSSPPGSRRIDDAMEDTAVDDSEPEAMIVDIEDVIEETASPLRRIQPHQTPVYSVTTSETTSIAVPLGTVTSSHEPSSAILVNVEDKHKVNFDLEYLTRTKSQEKVANVLSKESVNTAKYDRNKKALPSTLDRNASSSQRVIVEHTDLDEVLLSDSHELDKPDHITSCDDSNELREVLDASSKSDTVTSNIRLRVFDDRSSIDIPREDDHVEKTSIQKAVRCEVGALTKQKGFITTAATTNVMKEATVDFITDLQPVEDDGNGYERKDYDYEATDTMYDVDHKSEPRQLIENEIPKDEKKKKKSNVVQRSCELVDEPAVTTCLVPSADLKSFEDGSTEENEEAKEQEDDGLDAMLRPPRQHSQLRELEICSTSRDHERSTSPASDQQPETNREASKKIHRMNSNAEQNDKYVDGTLVLIRASEKSKEMEERSQQNSRTFEIHSSASGQASLDFPVETKIKTIVTTMPQTSCRDLRCYESIVVNEETLNKIVVPTAVSTEPPCEKRFVSRRESRYPYPAEASDETSRCSETRTQRRSYIDDNLNCSSLNRDINTKAKRRTSIEVSSFSLPSRNVFIKTKRMIFSPFRRGEDRFCDAVPAGTTAKMKKDDKAPRENLQRKSKSKSRSTSPKGLRRSDAALCRTVLLPWSHLGVTFGSKEPKSGESWDETRDGKDEKQRKGEARERGEERKDEIEEGRDYIRGFNHFGCSRLKNPLEKMGMKRPSAQIDEEGGRKEVTVGGFRSKEMFELDKRVLPVESDKKAVVTDRNERHSPIYEILGSKTTEKCHEELSRTTNTAVLPSDLVHKLRILSNVAARKDGRMDTKMDAQVDSSTSPSSSMDIRSSRLRRTKEAFLSHKSGRFALDSTTPMFLSSNDDASQRNRNTNANYKEITATSSLNRRVGMDYHPKTQSTTEPMANNSGSNATNNSKSDLVKSASAGMINVDPSTLNQLAATSDRGCESLPRTISKRYDFGISGPLARIANKLKLSRLMRGRDFSTNEGSLRTITTLCRQSLLIEVGRRNEQQEERQCVEESRQDGQNFRESQDNES